VLAWIECPEELAAEPVKALDADGWGFLAGAAATGNVLGVVHYYVVVRREAGRCLPFDGEVDVVASWACVYSRFGHDSERVG